MPVDVRVIAATHRNLEEEVRQGRFRADLYFRLAVARVRLPPLRTRREDIPVLAQRAARRRSSASVELTPQTLALFEGYDWPGNVRELRNVLERGALMQETGNSELAGLPGAARSAGRRAGARHQRGRAGRAACRTTRRRTGCSRDFERLYFAEVMSEVGFDMKAGRAAHRACRCRASTAC